MRYPEVRWSVQENMLQAYRMINISSQAFLLVVATLLSSRGSWILYPVAGIAVAMIYWTWIGPTVSRHLTADYYQIAMELGDVELKEFEKKFPLSDYVNDPTVREEANRVGGATFKTNWRLTRIKFDRWLPYFFALIWLALVLEQLINHTIKKIPS